MSAAALRTAVRTSCSVTPVAKSNLVVSPHPVNDLTCFPPIPMYARLKFRSHCCDASFTDALMTSEAACWFTRSPRVIASHGITLSARSSGSPWLSLRITALQTLVLPKSMAMRISS